MSRLTQILRGKNLTPLTEKESAVKYAVDNAGSGGGGGQGDSDVFIVNFEWDDNIAPDGGYKADKTYADTISAIDAGKVILGNELGCFGFGYYTPNVGSTNIRFNLIRVAIGASGAELMTTEFVFNSDNSVEANDYTVALSST